MSSLGSAEPPDGCLDEAMLVALTEGSIEPAEREAAQRHIRGCALCQEAFAALVSWGDPDRLSPRPTSLPEPGDIVGRYRIEHLVGVGGAGAVYRAADPLLKRTVALKMLHRQVEGRDPSDAAVMLATEAQALARLSHPHVAAIYDLGEHKGQLFLAMEWVDGGDLAEWLHAKPRSVEAILTVFRQAGEGLSAAHRVGLSHGDFKPHNVLIGSDGRARVTDFGFHDGRRWIGTAAYMAPEQREQGTFDARSDQFSWCVALYEALTGARPSVSRNEPVSTQALPRAVRSVLCRGLALRPEERFPNLETLLKELSPRKWLFAQGLALAVVMLALGALTQVWLERLAGQACTMPDTQMDAAFGSKAQSEIHQAFVASGLPFAEDSWERTRRALEDYRHRWDVERAESCLAERVRKEQTAETTASQIRCLDQRRGEFRAMVEVLSHADGNVVQHAVEAAQGLEPVSACARPALLAQTSLVITDNATSRKALADLQAAKALQKSFRLKQALEKAAAATAAPLDAVAVDQRIEALVLRGSLEAQLGSSAAEATLETALWDAQAHRLDRQAFQAALTLAEHRAYDAPKTAQLWTRFAQSLAGRMPEALRDDVALDLQGARMARMSNDAEAADALLHHALMLVRRAHPEGSFAELHVQELLAAISKHFGRNDAALAARQAVLNLATQLVGPGHFETARAMLELAEEHPFGPTEKISVIRAALPILVQTLGENSKLVGIAYDRLSQAQTYQGDLDAALESSQRAVRVLNTVAPEDAAYAFAVGNEGDVYLGKKDLPQARRRYTFELERRTALFGDDFHLTHPLIRLGELELELGHRRAAQAHFSHAAERWKKGPRAIDPAVLARLNFGQARTLEPAKRDEVRLLLDWAHAEAIEAGDVALKRRIEKAKALTNLKAP